MSLTVPTLPRGDAEKARLALLTLVRELQGTPLVAAVVVGPVDFASGETKAVAHGLGQAPRYWAPLVDATRTSSAVTFTSAAMPAGLSADQFIAVTASAAARSAFLVVP